MERGSINGFLGRVEKPMPELKGECAVLLYRYSNTVEVQREI